CCWDRLNDDARRDLAGMEAYLEGKVGREVLGGRWPGEVDYPNGCARWIIDWVLRHHPDTEPRQADLFRCMVGNPLRPSALDPQWLAGEGRPIPRLAPTIDTEQAWERLPILGDALEEAGCTDEEILVHCRETAHLRGCWVLGLLLNRG